MADQVILATLSTILRSFELMNKAAVIGQSSSLSNIFRNGGSHQLTADNSLKTALTGVEDGKPVEIGTKVDFVVELDEKCWQ